MTVPSHARIVVVGGGIAGCSTAYHLARLGETDVLLLEQGKLTCGTTWHAAGLIGQMRPNRTMTRMSRYGIGLYATLEAETGLATGWKQCGSVNVARTRERMMVLRKQLALARGFGVECEEISRERAGELFPLLRTDDLAGAIWIPGDGKANPADLTMSLAKGARLRGVKMVEAAEVVAVRGAAGPTGPRVTGLLVRHGGEEIEVACEVVVNCAGQWARQFGALAGVNVPLWSAEHFYIVTDRIDGVQPMLPVLRDPDGAIYYKEEVGGLLMGGFEANAKPWPVDPIPSTFQFELLDEDWDQFEPLMTAAIHRTPCLETARVKMLLNGPESFTPDGNFILGEAPRAAQFLRRRRASTRRHSPTRAAPDRAIAEWIVAGRRAERSRRRRHPPLRRSQRQQEGARRAEPARRSACTTRCAGRARSSRRRGRCGRARSTTCSPQGCASSVRRTAGSGRATFAPTLAGPGPSPARTRSASRPGSPTSSASSARHGWRSRSTTRPRSARSWCRAATRSPCFSACARTRSTSPPGESSYTPMLNDRAGFESDVTVIRLAVDRFLVVTGSAQTPRDLDWLARHSRAGASAALVDVTAMTSVLSLMGPGRARAARSRRLGRRLRAPRPRAAALREHGRDRPRLRARPRRAHELRRRPGYELMCRARWRATSISRCTKRAKGSVSTAPASPTRATTLSTPCGSRQAVEPGAPSSGRARRRSKPARCSRCGPAKTTTSSAGPRWCACRASRCARSSSPSSSTARITTRGEARLS
jgi:4-methylaminobutanoate oxidase (formaldehyde-forming)